MHNCQNYLKEKFSDEYELIANAPNPFTLGYEPCMDVSPFLSPDEVSYFHTVIGVMRWMVELGRIDIAVEVSQFSSFVAMLRPRNLVNELHVMSYLKIKQNSRLVLDPSYPGIDMYEFKSNENWAPLYGGVQEAKPLNALKPLDKEVTLRMFVDSDHVEDKRTVAPGQDS